jgi:pimeloyl-ACP methyl ester carboxylesterase
MLHGYSDSWFSFSRLLPLLPADHHAYALDQRGHGDSDRPAQGYAMADFAADVVAFMDALGLSSATVVGHSMGTLVAQELALAAPQRVAGLILLGGGSHIRTPEVFELQRAIDSFEDLVPVEFVQEFQASTIYHPVPTVFLEQVVAESMKLPARVWRSVLAGCLDVDYTARLSQIQMPALLLRGEQDGLFLAGQDALAAGLPNATVQLYHETGHALHWERPEQVAHDMEEFIWQLQLLSFEF